MLVTDPLNCKKTIGVSIEISGHAKRDDKDAGGRSSPSVHEEYGMFIE